MLVLSISAITMKRYLLLSTLLCLYAGAAAAQSEFTNGYIIKHDGSRTWGQVKYISKGFTPKECVFRWFDISTTFTFLPSDIEAFGFSYGMRYKAVAVKGEKIFMACLADGEVDLLYDGKTMYLDGDGFQMVSLNNKPGTVTVNGRMVSYTDYRDLLTQLDPEGSLKEKADLPLLPGEMKGVIETYNQSIGAEVELFVTKNPSLVYEEMRNMGAYMNSYGLIGGTRAFRFYAEKYSYVQPGFLPEMDFFEITPVVGAFFNRRLTRAKDILAMQAELMFFRSNVYMYYESSDWQGISRSDVNIDFTGIKVPLMLQARLMKGNLRPYVNAGVNFVFNLKKDYTREGEIENALHEVRMFTDNSMVLNKTIIGGIAGVGFRKEFNPRQNLFVEARGEYGSGIFTRGGMHQKTITFSIVAGLDFR